MTNNKDILAITHAIQYFQSSINQETLPSQLEKHLNTLNSSLNKEEITAQLPVGFLLNVLSLLASRYYEIMTGQNLRIQEEYLLVKIVTFIAFLYRLSSPKNNNNIKKELIVIIMWATVSKAKNAFKDEQTKLTDLRSALLDLNQLLLTEIVKRQDFKSEEIYPKQYSLLSEILKNSKINLKQFSSCIQTMNLLVQNNPKLLSSKDSSTFILECRKRLLSDIKFFVDRFQIYESGFQNKISILASKLLEKFQHQKEQEIFDLTALTQQSSESIRKELFSSVVLLAQLCNIEVNINKYSFFQRTIIQESYKSIYLQTCRHLLKLEINIQQKKKELRKMSILNAFVTFIPDQNDENLNLTVQCLNRMFSIRKSHNLITIPYHSTTIPLDKMLPSHTFENYPIKGLDKEYRRELSRMIVEIMPFFELEPSLIDSTSEFLSKMNQNNREALLQYYSDQLLKYEYHTSMSLTQLYTHLQNICIIKFLLAGQVQSIHYLNSIFHCLSTKSQALKSLKASFVEEQLLIAVTLQIIKKCSLAMNEHYGKSKDIRGKIKQSQLLVVFIEKVLNELREPSYLIRLICTIALLEFTQTTEVKQSLQPYQATIILRNKNNLQLILSLFEITSMNPVDYEQLALYYLKHQGAEPVLRFLITKVSVQIARKCILTVQRWWLLLSIPVMEYLNCKIMNTSQNKEDNFATNDKQNVTIKNALGVIIIELGQKWIHCLRSSKRQAIVDILNSLASLNSDMVFFKSGFSKVLQQIYQILLQCLGHQNSSVSLSQSKKKNIPSKASLLQPEQIEFYSRLRFKVYNFLNTLPTEWFTLYQNQVLDPLKSLLLSVFDKVKKEYLFDGNTQCKDEYEVLKKLSAKLDAQ